MMLSNPASTLLKNTLKCIMNPQFTEHVYEIEKYKILQSKPVPYHLLSIFPLPQRTSDFILDGTYMKI